MEAAAACLWKEVVVIGAGILAICWKLADALAKDRVDVVPEGERRG